MPFSSKAQEIHNRIARIGKTDYWIGLARSLAERVAASTSREDHTPTTFPALRDKFQAGLSGAVNNDQT